MCSRLFVNSVDLLLFVFVWILRKMLWLLFGFFGSSIFCSLVLRCVMFLCVLWILFFVKLCIDGLVSSFCVVVLLLCDWCYNVYCLMIGLSFVCLCVSLWYWLRLVVMFLWFSRLFSLVSCVDSWLSLCCMFVFMVWSGVFG